MQPAEWNSSTKKKTKERKRKQNKWRTNEKRVFSFQLKDNNQALEKRNAFSKQKDEAKQGNGKWNWIFAE